MPLFEYRCEDCSARHELIVPMSDREHPDSKCHCGGTLIRVYSPFDSISDQVRISTKYE